MNKKEIEELQEILVDYTNLIIEAWVDGVDKDYEIKKVDRLHTTLERLT